jgi:hypothetical protein
LHRLDSQLLVYQGFLRYVRALYRPIWQLDLPGQRGGKSGRRSGISMPRFCGIYSAQDREQILLASPPLNLLK